MNYFILNSKKETILLNLTKDRAIEEAKKAYVNDNQISIGRIINKKTTILPLYFYI